MTDSLMKGLYGDGIHDDTAGIQALLDAGTSAVYLPPPPKHYLISRTLIIHSGQTLRLDPFTVIRLAPRSRNDVDQTLAVPVKEIFLYPLRSDFRGRLLA